MTAMAILGAGGRMGRALVRCAQATADAAVCAAIDRPDHDAIGGDAGVVAGLDPIGVPVGDDPKQLGASDVVIDFTFHSAVPDHVRAARDVGKGFVLGTTGLSDAEADVVHAAASDIPVVWAPNMSLGMNLLFAMVRQAAATLDQAYDIEIVEAHHRHKQDAPSGTALGLAEQAAGGREVDLGTVADYGRRGMTGERVPGRIGIHAIRGGDIVGDHTVIFATDGERLELTHRAGSRDIFAAGAVRAALWAAGKPAGLYNMQDVLELAPTGE